MRKNLCIVLILLICFVTTFTYAENESENNSTNLQTQDLQTQKNDICHATVTNVILSSNMRLLIVAIFSILSLISLFNIYIQTKCI